MKIFCRMTIAGLIFSAVLLAAFISVFILPAQAGKSATWRYKMTVTVETPEGIKTGSAVREISNSVQGMDLPDVGNPAGVRGEAVVVDLGARGVLFALISDLSDNEFYNAFPTDGPATSEGIKYYASLPVGKTGVLNPKNFPGYPKLVTFTDLENPKSVTLIQVWERNKQGYFDLKEDRFERLFGAGVELKDIKLEITDAPITNEIASRLPWLPEIGGMFLDGSFVATGDSLGIHGGNFKLGGGK